MKLSIPQSVMLRIIANASVENGDLAGIRLAWYARDNATLEGRSLSFSAETMGPALKALYRKGLATPYPKLGKYSSIITDLGLKVAASEVGKPVCCIDYYDQQWMRERREAGLEE